jgi:hypothetical protein
MRSIKVLFVMTALTLGCSSVSFAAEDAPKPAASAAIRTCSANSADRLQSCSVSCPEGKTATCVGGAQWVQDVDCTCK